MSLELLRTRVLISIENERRAFVPLESLRSRDFSSGGEHLFVIHPRDLLLRNDVLSVNSVKSDMSEEVSPVRDDASDKSIASVCVLPYVVDVTSVLSPADM